jgi:two-component system response regulator FixJ
MLQEGLMGLSCSRSGADALDKSRPLVAIVDDDQAVRRSTAALLEICGYRVREFAGGDAFLATQDPVDFDCVLLDLQMPGTSGIGVLNALQAWPLKPAVLVLTGHGAIAKAVEAMKLGAYDFLEKPYPAKSLIDAISGALAARAQARTGAIDGDAVARISSLSRRQREVLQGVLDGKPNKIIAYELGLSIRTVEAYRAQLLEKLGVRGTAEAVRLAISAGMLAVGENRGRAR